MSRRQQELARIRKHDQRLEARAQSAAANGISRQKIPDAILPCQAGKGSDTHYEFCNLSRLTVVLTASGQATTAVVFKSRCSEPVATTALHYHDELQSHDLVMEVLSIAAHKTRAGNKPAEYTKKLITATGQALDDRTPAHVQVTAANGPQHTQFQPLHPASSIIGGDIVIQTDGGRAADSYLELPRLSILTPGTWGRVWPFGTNDAVIFNLEGNSCGNPPPPQKALTRLAVHMPVFPDEEWKVKFGLGTYKSAQSEAEQRGAGAIEITYTEKSGNRETETKVEHYEDGQAKKTVKTSTGMVISTFKETEQSRAAHRKKFKQSEKPKKGKEAAKIDIEWKVAGQEAEFDAAEVINGLLKIADVLQELADLLDGPSVGWSAKVGYSLFDGDLVLTWGHRWPTTYSELDRVYYVEKYIGIGGRCTLLKGEIEGMVGVDIDPWWLPGTIIAKAFLKVDIELGIEATSQRTWSNANLPHLTLSEGDKNRLVKIKGEASFEPEIGLTGGGKLFGVGVIATAKIEGTQKLELDATITLAEGPTASTSFASDPVQGVIQVEYSWLTTSVWESEPKIFIEGREGWKDRKLF